MFNVLVAFTIKERLLWCSHTSTAYCSAATFYGYSFNDTFTEREVGSNEMCPIGKYKNLCLKRLSNNNY